ncbi:MAG: DUF4112 domain-containing protein [Hyphomonas sp.]
MPQPLPAAAGGTRDSMARFSRLSHFLDAKFAVPGTSFRFGLDGIIGLIPVAGDVLMGVAGLYALKVASDYKLPWHVHWRILWNLLVDTVIGSIPVVGDIFDFVHKAHSKNRRILERSIAKREKRLARQNPIRL